MLPTPVVLQNEETGGYCDSQQKQSFDLNDIARPTRAIPPLLHSALQMAQPTETQPYKSQSYKKVND